MEPENQNQTPVPEPTIQSIPQKNQKLPIIVMSFVTILSLAATAYFGYQNYLLKGQISQTQPTSITTTSLSSPTTNPTTDQTANWEVYTNAEYGFSFKHPDNLSISEISVVAKPYTGTSVFLDTISDPSTEREGTDAPFDGFSIYVVTNTEAASFDDYIQNEKVAMASSPLAFMAGATEQELDQGSALINNTRGYYYLQSLDKTTMVVFAYVQGNETFRETFNQILTTFSFAKQLSS